MPWHAIAAKLSRSDLQERQDMERQRWPPPSRVPKRAARQPPLATGAAAALFVVQAGAEPGLRAEYELARPYLRAAWDTPVASLARLVCSLAVVTCSEGVRKR